MNEDFERERRGERDIMARVSHTEFHQVFKLLHKTLFIEPLIWTAS